jgi:hypothetical protein
MRRHQVVLIAGWAVLSAGVVALGRAAVMPLTVNYPTVAGMRARPEALHRPMYDTDSLRSAIVARDMFRIARRPAAAPYNPQGDAVSMPTLVRPSLLLRGILLGDTARALIEGFAGMEGARVVRAGETVAGVRIGAITRQQVRILTPDTTWVLWLRRTQ